MRWYPEEQEKVTNKLLELFDFFIKSTLNYLIINHY